jgi:hypothetical protein
MSGARPTLAILATVLLGASAVRAQAPDLLSMSGVPLPMADVPARAAMVRVVRYDMAHPVAGVDVTLTPTAGGAPRQGRTDPSGRAAFESLGPGEYVARVTVDGKELRSQPFAAGEPGIRMLLVAPGAPGAPASPPGGGVAMGPQASRPALPPGHPPIGDEGEEGERAPASAPSGPTTTDPTRLSLGSGSEIAIDFVEDAVRVTALWRLRNDGPTYDPGPGGLVIRLPEGVVEVNVPPGSPGVRAEGKTRVVIRGLIGPGESRVAYQYVVPYRRGVTLAMPMPVRSDGLVVGVRPTALTVEIPGATPRDEVTTPEGVRFLVSQMGSLPAGSDLTVRFGHHRLVEWLAGGAVLVLLAWLFFGSQRRGRPALAELTAQRDRLLEELTNLERRDHGQGGRRYGERRGELLAKLEPIYREIDAQGAPLM